jgi:hypothetical protein
LKGVEIGTGGARAKGLVEVLGSSRVRMWSRLAEERRDRFQTVISKQGYGMRESRKAYRIPYSCAAVSIWP